MANRFSHGQKYDIFLSYSSTNAPWVRRFHDDLQRDLRVISGKDVEIFLDKGRLLPGDRWDEKLLDAVVQSAVFVAVLSPGFLESSYCSRELNTFLSAHQNSLPAGYKSHVATVELLLEVRSVEQLKPFQASRFFKKSGAIRTEFKPGTTAYDTALRALSTGITEILESLATNPAKEESSRPAFSKQPEIRFLADCVVDEQSVATVLDPSGSPPSIRFHPAVLAEIARLDDWWNNFDVRSAIFPWGAEDPVFRRSSLTTTRAQLLGHRDRLQAQFHGASDKLRRTLEATLGASLAQRQAAVAQVARFLALQVMRLIQFTDSYLPDPGPVPHTSFPTLPRVPPWLVDLYPKRSAIGELVFQEPQFLLAHVGQSETEVETVVIPRQIAEYLHRSSSIGDLTTYYRWVLPQWLHYRFERPLPPAENWRIWLLKDDQGRECYLSSSTPPWQ